MVLIISLCAKSTGVPRDHPLRELYIAGFICVCVCVWGGGGGGGGGGGHSPPLKMFAPPPSP